MSDLPVLNVNLYERTIGTIVLMPGDRSLFVFTEDYINAPERPTLSLAFKDQFGELITQIKPTQTRVPPFFSNLLPEGAMRDYLAKQAGVKSQREFFLLAALGKDLPGAITITPADEFQALHDENEHHEMSANKDGTQKILRFSLAGVQLKFSAIKKARGGLTIPADGIGGSWIVKLPDTKYSGVPENEFVMMELARAVGLDVPRTLLIPIEKIEGLPIGIEKAGKYAYAIERFDRSDNDNAIHIEDFAQIFSVYPEKKYQGVSYRNIAEVIMTETGEVGLREFIKRIVFNALIGNADMHLKNWSLIYPDKINAKLAPAYDFLSTIPYLADDEMALNFVDKKTFASLSKEQFVRFANKARLPEWLVIDTALETVALFREQWHLVDDLGIEPKVKEVLNQHLSTIPIYQEFKVR